MKTEERHVIWGNFGSAEDMAVLSYFRHTKWSTPMMYLAVHLFPHRPWYKRWIKAARYALGERSCYGDFNEIVIDPLDVKDLMRFLQQFLYDIDEARVSRE